MREAALGYFVVRVPASPSAGIESVWLPAHTIAGVTDREDIATVAGQLAVLTRTVEEMAVELKTVRERAETDRERTDVQQERIDLAAHELADVSERLQAAANALRESI
jgi:hypothetical protein